MIQFKKYNSVENTFDTAFMEVISFEGYNKREFVVQEKIHGCNVCFICDGETVAFGKRTGFVEADEVFYDYETLLARYKPKITALFSMVKTEYPDIEAITVFGEMFGGIYPHPDVENDRKIMKIQKGVYYCPQHEFYAFDLYVKTQENGRYLGVDEANSFFEKGDFFYAKTLFRGTLEQCLHYPNDSLSLIFEWFGLPPIEDNVCEGVVIRPVETSYLSNGSRILLKSKNARFAEKKSRKKRDAKPFVPPSYSENLAELIDIAELYVTENRLNNVMSKIGQISLPKEVGKLLGLFSKDILEDFLKEHSGKYAVIEKVEQKILNRHVNSFAINLIKEIYFKNFL
ncbi:MAG: RNA ligase, Rnl2 family [Lentimicrobiaceae bacterium]|nr:RNA ligase, Rnl2 family [Lentimicrobiaceae bacterium]